MSRHEEFVNQVKLMYRSLGYSVVNEEAGRNQGFDFVLQTTLPGIGEQIVYVECKGGNKPTSLRQIQLAYRNFDRALDEKYGKSKTNHSLVLVSQAGFIGSARQISRELAITCISLQELSQQVLEQEPYLRQLAASEQSERYVDLDIKIGSFGEFELLENSGFSAAIDDWRTSTSHPVFWLRGKAGSGKSFSVRWFANRLAEMWLQKDSNVPTPVLISLRPNRSDVDIFELVAKEIGFRWRKETTKGVILSQMQSGQLLLILDGLDLLHPDEQRRLLLQISEVCLIGSPKVVITSRRGVPNDKERVPELRRFTNALWADLQELTFAQIQQFLTHSENEVGIAQSFENSKIFRNFRTPLFLRLLEDLGGQADFIRSGINSKLLENMVRSFIEREVSKTNSSHMLTFETISALAVSMHLKSSNEFGTADFGVSEIEGHQTQETAATLASFPLFSCTRTSPSRFSFVHRSIVDILLAHSVIQNTDGRRPEILAQSRLNAECVDIIVGHGIDGRILDDWASDAYFEIEYVGYSLENIDSIRRAWGFDTSIDQPSIRVRKLFLQNIRCFEKAEIPFEMQDNYAGMSLLVGNNGVGKSTISQCVSLCALGPDLASRIVPRPSELLSSGSEEGVMKCEFEVSDISGQISTVVVGMKILRDRKMFDLIESGPHSSINSRAFLFERLQSKTESCFVAAYGPTRNLDLTGDPKLYAQGDAVLNRVESMFDPHHALIDPESLRRIMIGDGGPFEQFGAPSVLPNSVSRPVTNILLSLLPADDRVQFSDDGKLVGEFGPLEFSQLSDGYRSTLAWAGHLVVNLLQFVGWRSDITRVSGIVMVDEIDLHLHPKWQRTIVTRLREAFPRIQFILSSHSPLVVADADGNEARVMLLSRDDASVRITDELPSFKGWRADQILASEAFDYLVDRDPKTEATLRELSILSGKGKQRSHDEEARYLELVSFWSIDRLVDGQTEIERQLQVDQFRTYEKEIRAKENRIFGGSND